MKYYSEITKKLYDDKKTLIDDEARVINEQKEQEQKSKQLKEERASRAKAIEEAYKLANEQYAKADNMLEEFLKDYGSFHTTMTNVKPRFSHLIDDLFNSIF